MSQPQNKFLEFFDSIAKSINFKDPRKTIIHLADTTKKMIDADRCSIFLYDRDHELLYTYYAHGVERIVVPVNQGIVGKCFREGRVINLEDAYKDPDFNRESDRIHEYRTKSLLAVPLKTPQGRTIGVFEALNKENAPLFTEEDILIIENVSLYTASILEGIALYERLKRTQREVILRLSNATKFKDKETKNHLVRVGLYTQVFAEALDWAPEDVEMIRLASPMHDIGKVGIPDSVLQKHGDLSPEEWEIMKKHTIYGYEILKGSESRLIQVAALIALEHHEKWNGSGYPYGKKEKEISIYGRITAIADVFDALTSDRPYKKAWDAEKARDHIASKAGKEFDPLLVDIFVRHFDKFAEIREQYKDQEVDLA
ncbi:metal dependent phosphohydrolase [Thermosulfidibacter takaii ABI70S6]|uniref:Metal dependent phosphohydrolase n=1 Tax=Thermosulfidibacter takaii (strain DSM 17441 / JCM 13301 / NBRC 103674 / ABI70S6) TaxID=1298851 RepID=A0A0S3QTP0_THET7|nr:HD domain-containing phosphohydrolase [Thermosulfidibacter takaii]BAT71704.1 metal dependent phosphohydrolase [Thermosulfidibacter takaii ABI70S6]